MNVHLRPSSETCQLVARRGSISVVPGRQPTSWTIRQTETTDDWDQVERHFYRILSPSEFHAMTGATTQFSVLMLTNQPVKQGWGYNGVEITGRYADGTWPEDDDNGRVEMYLGVYAGPASDMNPGGCSGIC